MSSEYYLFQRLWQQGGKWTNFAVDKPDKQHLGQVLSAVDSMHSWYVMNRALYLPKPIHNLSLIIRKTSDKSYLRDTPQNTWTSTFKILKVIQSKKNLRDGLNAETPQETRPVKFNVVSLMGSWDRNWTGKTKEICIKHGHPSPEGLRLSHCVSPFFQVYFRTTHPSTFSCWFSLKVFTWSTFHCRHVFAHVASGT